MVKIPLENSRLKPYKVEKVRFMKLYLWEGKTDLQNSAMIYVHEYLNEK